MIMIRIYDYNFRQLDVVTPGENLVVITYPCAKLNTGSANLCK